MCEAGGFGAEGKGRPAEAAVGDPNGAEHQGAQVGMFVIEDFGGEMEKA